jgi:hypothetical protein
MKSPLEGKKLPMATPIAMARISRGLNNYRKPNFFRFNAGVQLVADILFFIFEKLQAI